MSDFVEREVFVDQKVSVFVECSFLVEVTDLVRAVQKVFVLSVLFVVGSGEDGARMSVWVHLIHQTTHLRPQLLHFCRTQKVSDDCAAFGAKFLSSFSEHRIVELHFE